MINQWFIMNKNGLELTGFSDMYFDGGCTGCKREGGKRNFKRWILKKNTIVHGLK